MRLLARVYLVVQRLIFAHARLVALKLGTIVGIDNHIVHNGLTPNGSSTTRHIIVAIAVAAMVSAGLLRVGFVDVARLVEESFVEVVVGFPLCLVVIGNGKLGTSIASTYQKAEDEN